MIAGELSAVAIAFTSTPDVARIVKQRADQTRHGALHAQTITDRTDLLITGQQPGHAEYAIELLRDDAGVRHVFHTRLAAEGHA